MNNPPTWCRSCLAMSTRPRITFDNEGRCNACAWSDAKLSLDWSQRGQELDQLLSRHRRNEGHFDCLVPVSGGKDGSYVAYNLRHKFGMNPLCVTVTPPLPTSIGEQNLRSFVASGYNHISVNPNFDAMRTLNKHGFIELGFPYYGWLAAILTVPILIARQFDIGIIFYGEDGEVEYGGSTETIKNPIFGIDYIKKVYLEGGYERVLNTANLNKEHSVFFNFPDEKTSKTNNLEITHWSYFENWDPYRNYLIAKEFCGLSENEDTNSGTFTNYAQNDQSLYALHTYLMYLKFGFGRANQDACIDIRRGAMDRDQALNLVKMFDGHFPSENLETYCEYYEMTEDDFLKVLDKWANKDLFKKQDGRWVSQFEIH